MLQNGESERGLNWFFKQDPAQQHSLNNEKLTIQEVNMINKEILKQSNTELYLNEKYRPDNFSKALTINENIQISSRVELDRCFRSNMNSIFIVTEGYGTIYLNTEEVELKKNSLILIPQNISVRIKKQEDKIYLSGIYFSSHFISQIRVPQNVLKVFNHFTSHFLSAIDLEEKEANFIITQIKELIDSNMRRTQLFGKELLIISFQQLLMKIGGLRQEYSEIIKVNYSPQEYLYVKFNDLVQNQFKEERMIKNYANQLNVTAKYLSEVVKEHSGKQASRIVKDLVISEARFLLADPELNISQIAEKLHFSDVSTFGKYFRNETGQSPKQYRVNTHFSFKDASTV